MVNIALVGCNGKMGKAVTSAVQSRNDCEIVFGADPFGTPAYDYPVFESLAVSDKKAAKILGAADFDIEIIEKHHNQKIDAPSGTALMIADGISDTLAEEPQYVYDRHSYRKKRSKNEIGIHSVRGGTIVGEHEVIFAGHDEVVTISHQAQSKEVFAVGAVNAAVYLADQSAGMYNMGNLLAAKLG